jgi:hypothetical protein
MRKSLLFISVFGPLAAVAGLTLTAAAQSDTGSIVSQPAAPLIDLDAIPVKPVSGPQAVQGVGDDDDDEDMHVAGDLRRLSADSAEYEDDEHHSGRGHDDDDDDGPSHRDGDEDDD